MAIPYGIAIEAGRGAGVWLPSGFPVGGCRQSEGILQGIAPAGLRSTAFRSAMRAGESLQQPGVGAWPLFIPLPGDFSAGKRISPEARVCFQIFPGHGGRQETQATGETSLDAIPESPDLPVRNPGIGCYLFAPFMNKHSFHTMSASLSPR